MSLRHPIEQTLLWLFVVLAAIVVGGGLYEMRVIVPLWANSPPESVWYWQAQRFTNPQYAPNAGVRFWIFVTPAHLVISLMTLVAAWKTQRRHRFWVISATIIFIMLHLSALFYFVPALEKIYNSRSLNLPPEEIISRVHLWVRGSWLRFAIALVGFFCGMQALRKSPNQPAVVSPPSSVSTSPVT